MNSTVTILISYLAVDIELASLVSDRIASKRNPQWTTSELAIVVRGEGGERAIVDGDDPRRIEIRVYGSSWAACDPVVNRIRELCEINTRKTVAVGTDNYVLRRLNMVTQCYDRVDPENSQDYCLFYVEANASTIVLLEGD